MRIALYAYRDQHGSVLMANTITVIEADKIPVDIDDVLDDFEADFYEVLND